MTATPNDAADTIDAPAAGVAHAVPHAVPPLPPGPSTSLEPGPDAPHETPPAVRPGPAFVPPHPEPQTRPLSTLQLLRRVYSNPLEVWGSFSYERPTVDVTWWGIRTVVVNDPKLIRQVLVTKAANYPFGSIRQRILRPILRDGLLTAEGDVWRRARKAMAPVFTPASIRGFAGTMRSESFDFIRRYEGRETTDVAHDMTELTYDIMAATLFSGEIAGEPGQFAAEIETLFDTMGRTDPLDIFGAPSWVPRPTKLRGRGTLDFFRSIVRRTVDERRAAMASGADVPRDFLTLLLEAEANGGLQSDEVEDNIITFIGAGHETTARALGWTLYCLAESEWDREQVEAEIDAAWDTLGAPETWIDSLPRTRAAFEEAMRLYPPAPTIAREAKEADRLGDIDITPGTAIQVMPWTLHRHRKLWDEPNAFRPERFWPDAREGIDRFQYLPFGAGPRVCIGQTFAMWEGVIALAVLLRHYRFDTYRHERPWPVQRLTTQPEGGLPMRVTKR